MAFPLACNVSLPPNSKRPTVEECREHRWLTESDFMAKKRERATFFGNRLRVRGTTDDRGQNSKMMITLIKSISEHESCCGGCKLVPTQL